jgi:ribosomal protein L25 (general stress protein Ctc)
VVRKANTTAKAASTATRSYATINHDESYIIQDFRRYAQKTKIQPNNDIFQLARKFDFFLFALLEVPKFFPALPVEIWGTTFNISMLFFHSECRPLSCRLRKHESDSGKSYARAARASGVIPGVINRGTDSPCFIEMDPRQIVSYMERRQSRFMGRRYKIKVEDTGAEYEVVPHQLDVVPTNLRPLAVTFSLYDQKSVVPARVPRHVQRIMFEGVGARYDSFGRRRSKAQRRKELADAEK